MDNTVWEAKRRCDTLILATERALVEYKDKVSAPERRQIANAAADLRRAIKGDDAEIIADKITALSTASNALWAAIHGVDQTEPVPTAAQIPDQHQTYLYAEKASARTTSEPDVTDLATLSSVPPNSAQEYDHSTTSKPRRSGYRYIVAFGVLLVGLMAGFVFWLGFNIDFRHLKANVEKSPPVSAERVPLDSTEQVPPIATDAVLSLSQIRYCLAEAIRLDEMMRLVDTTSKKEVAGYNAATDDYNSRCNRFKYRKTEFDLAQTEITAKRAALLVEAKRRVMAWR